MTDFYDSFLAAKPALSNDIQRVIFEANISCVIQGGTWRRRVDQVMIPTGCTAHLKSLDLVIREPFIDLIRSEINRYTESEAIRN